MDERTIKSAYRKLAVRYHPDRNPDDPQAEEKFKEAAEAYAVLSDPDKRSRYDRFGHQAAGAGGFGGFDPATFGDFADILGDFFGFGDIFGRAGRSRTRGRPGADLRYELKLTLEEAAFGTEKDITIPRLETCPECAGNGSAPGSSPQTCSACHGQGQVRFSQGFLTVARTCPQCGGEGQVITDPCADCRGGGRVERERRVELKIPPGVDSGSRLRLGGQGEHGLRGGPTGDLFVDLIVAPHEEFERAGADTLAPLLLSYAQLVLGTTVEVATLHGPEEVTVPAGSKPGSQFRLRGKGIPRLGGAGRGDHIVVAQLNVPRLKELSEEQHELLQRLAEIEGTPVKGERGVLERVKDLFH